MGAGSEAVIKGGVEAEAALSAAERRRDGRARVAALAHRRCRLRHRCRLAWPYARRSTPQAPS